MSKIDRNKKYEGLGLTWFHSGYTRWNGGIGRNANVSEQQMQTWLDAGHIQPVRETRIVRVDGVTVNISPLGNVYVDWEIPIELKRYGAISRPVTLEFEVKA